MEVAQRSVLQKPLVQSVLVHALVLLVFLIGQFLFRFNINTKRTIKVEIKEVISTPVEQTQPQIQVQNQPQPLKTQKTKQIFGLSKNSLKSDAPGAVEVKTGNTLAKDIDQEKMKPGDEEALPIPTEEYLVQQMPKLKSEVRINYPKEARAKNIEGVVLMDILIDEKGKVRSAQLIEGPGYGLNEAALKAIYQFEFSPAMLEKKPVAVKIRYAYRFVLN